MTNVANMEWLVKSLFGWSYLKIGQTGIWMLSTTVMQLESRKGFPNCTYLD